MQNEQTSLSDNATPKKGKSETISELAHRHLRDENHTTTDEELRNATVELTDDERRQDNSLHEVDHTTVMSSSTEGELGTDTDMKSDDEDDDNVPNPYNVLSK